MTDVDLPADFFKALADPIRLRIVALLANSELCVCHLQEALEAPQPTVSRHLGVLRNARVVDVRREGAWSHYSLANQEDDTRREHLQLLVRRFRREGTLSREVKRLVKKRPLGDCR